MNKTNMTKDLQKETVKVIWNETCEKIEREARTALLSELEGEIEKLKLKYECTGDEECHCVVSNSVLEEVLKLINSKR